MPLREKLEQAKTKLKELYETYPYLEEFKIHTSDVTI
jgi:hypothetical protein